MKYSFKKIQSRIGLVFVLAASFGCGSGGDSAGSGFQASSLPQLGGERYLKTATVSCNVTDETILDASRSLGNYISFEGMKFVQVETAFLTEGCSLEYSSQVRQAEENSFYISNHSVDLKGDTCGSQDEELLEFGQAVWNAFGELEVQYEISGNVLRLTYVGGGGCAAYVHESEGALESSSFHSDSDFNFETELGDNN